MIVNIISMKQYIINITIHFKFLDIYPLSFIHTYTSLIPVRDIVDCAMQ